jgi:hypothetical protein
MPFGYQGLQGRAMHKHKGPDTKIPCGAIRFGTQ